MHVSFDGYKHLFLFSLMCSKAYIQKTKIMASGPITSWEIDGETVETVSDFWGGAPKSLQMVIAAMKWKVMTKLDSILKSRDITLSTKVRLVSSVQFSCSVVSDSLHFLDLLGKFPTIILQLFSQALSLSLLLLGPL